MRHGYGFEGRLPGERGGCRGACRIAHTRAELVTEAQHRMHCRAGARSRCIVSIRPVLPTLV